MPPKNQAGTEARQLYREINETRAGKVFLLQWAMRQARLPGSKAAEDRRSPKPGGTLEAPFHAPASWSAPVLWRFGRAVSKGQVAFVLCKVSSQTPKSGRGLPHSMTLREVVECASPLALFRRNVQGARRF